MGSGRGPREWTLSARSGQPSRPTSTCPACDGVVVQDGSTADLIFDVPSLIAYLSASFTLLPGDVILTGTPAGVGPVEHGQRVEVEIDGIGPLANPFVRR